MRLVALLKKVAMVKWKLMMKVPMMVLMLLSTRMQTIIDKRNERALYYTIKNY